MNHRFNCRFRTDPLDIVALIQHPRYAVLASPYLQRALAATVQYNKAWAVPWEAIKFSTKSETHRRKRTFSARINEYRNDVCSSPSTTNTMQIPCATARTNDLMPGRKSALDRQRNVKSPKAPFILPVKRASLTIY